MVQAGVSGPMVVFRVIRAIRAIRAIKAVEVGFLRCVDGFGLNES